MQSLTQQFTAWVRTKPADATYCYNSNGHCAFARFLVEMGMARLPNVGTEAWNDLAVARDTGQIVDHAMPPAIDLAVEPKPHTFGALADRLSRIDAKVTDQ